MTGKRLTEIYEQLQESSKRKENSLLTIDDFQAQLKKKDIIKILQKNLQKWDTYKSQYFYYSRIFKHFKNHYESW